MKRIGPYLAAAALFAAAASFALRTHEPRAASAQVPPAALPRAAPAAAGSESAAAEPAPAPDELPAALRDTEVDGDLPVDANGELVVGPSVRRFFDYFGVASGDLSPEALRVRVLAELERRRLPPTAAAQALALFDRYQEYRRRAAELDADRSDDYEARLTALWALRREVIGPRDAAAMFGEEEDSVRAALDRKRIEDDPRLSPEEKDQALAENEARLPDAERDARASALSAVRLFNDEQALRARGASAEEIRSLREERVGAEAADRLEALDRERAAFQSALDVLRAQKNALDANAALTPETRDQTLRANIARLVAPEDRRHAEVLLGLP